MTNEEKFLERAIVKFGDKFDYSSFIYINAKTKGIIICPIHGEFLKTPEKHISKDSNGCNKCYYDKCRNTKREKYESSPRIEKKDLLQEFKDTYPDLEDVSSNTLTRWVKKYAEENDLEYTDRKIGDKYEFKLIVTKEDDYARE